MSRITACFLVGAAIGGVSLGYLGDKIGRVRGMVVCMLTYSIFTGLCYFVTAPWQMGACIFVAAIGMGGEWSLAVALVVECWPERHRAKLAGIIGRRVQRRVPLHRDCSADATSNPTDWRWLMLVGASPAVLALLVIFFVPESERWKASVKKGGRSPIIAIFGPGILSKTVFAAVLSGIPLIGTWAAVSAYIPNWGRRHESGAGGEEPADGRQSDKVRGYQELQGEAVSAEAIAYRRTMERGKTHHRT